MTGAIMETFPASEFPHLFEMTLEHVLQPGYDYGKELESGVKLVLHGIAGLEPFVPSASLNPQRVHVASRPPASATIATCSNRGFSRCRPRAGGVLSFVWVKELRYTEVWISDRNPQEVRAPAEQRNRKHP